MYKSNDKVRVKTWDELLATPGASIANNSIRHEFGLASFTVFMNKFCGQQLVLGEKRYAGFSIKDGDPSDNYVLEDWMLTPAEETMEPKPTTMRLSPLDYVARLEDLKVRDWVYALRYGWLRVREIAAGAIHPIRTERVSTWDSLWADYMADGRLAASDVAPSLFTVDIFNGTPPPEREADWPNAAAMGRPECMFWDVVGFNLEDSVDGQLVAYLEDRQDAEFPFVAFIEEVGFRRFKYCRLVDPKPEYYK